ncbi:MAG: hypothetical protein HZA90_12695 [Verrucomicrobia bacterium]|nr:hypothetical protein [Verrucomicrobiota bacterium]
MVAATVAWLGLAGLKSVSATVEPSQLPLVRKTHFTYLGAFALPQGDFGGSRFGYGGHAVTPYLDPVTSQQTLFLEGHAWYPGQVAQVEVPSELVNSRDWESLPVARVLQPFADVTDGRFGSLDGDGFVYGMLPYNGRLIVGAAIYYDGACVQVNSHGRSGLDLSVSNDFQGLYPMTAAANPRSLGGYLTPIPIEWRALFGGPALTGNGGLAIISCSSAGPAATVFDPDAVGVSNPIPGATVLFYPLAHPLALENSQNPLFNLATHFAGLAFPPQSRSVLFIGRHGTGPYCYGTGGASGGDCYDPADSSKGTHAYPYQHQVWAYDANELVQVKRGEKQPWEVVPYQVWSLDDLDTSGEADLAGAGFDPATGRLYLAQNYGEEPRIDVYEIRVPAACRACEAPPLPLTGTRLVPVATEPQLQAAMGSLRHGDTILLADGTYVLTSSLYVNGRNNVTLRGAAGCTNVVLAGRGMDNASHGGVLFGIWSNGTNTTIAHLTIRDTYDNSVIFNPGAQSPRLYSVKLLNAGSQFIKANVSAVTNGVNRGVVEWCWLEYLSGPPSTDHGAGVGYFNGISAHAARNWIVRGNVFKDLHNPDTAAYLWNPAVLMWRRSADTVTERNVFINVDRAIAYGLENNGSPDHAGGVIRNNFVYLTPGLMSAARRASSDAAILAWNSPGTAIDHNTVLVNSNVSYAVEFRFADTTGGAARHNLADAPIHLRDSATATLTTNLLTANSNWFVNPAAADLHLLPSATNAIDKAPLLASVTNDLDGETRPQGTGADLGADEIVARPKITAVSLVNGNLVVRFTTLAGSLYSLEAASDLVSSAWSSAITNLIGTGGILTATDTNATARTQRFYRVKGVD